MDKTLEETLNKQKHWTVFFRRIFLYIELLYASPETKKLEAVITHAISMSQPGK